MMSLENKSLMTRGLSSTQFIYVDTCSIDFVLLAVTLVISNVQIVHIIVCQIRKLLHNLLFPPATLSSVRFIGCRMDRADKEGWYARGPGIFLLFIYQKVEALQISISSPPKKLFQKTLMPALTNNIDEMMSIHSKSSSVKIIME